MVPFRLELSGLAVNIEVPPWVSTPTARTTRGRV